MLRRLALHHQQQILGSGLGLQIGHVRLLGQPVRAGIAAGVSSDEHPLETGHGAMRVRLNEAAGRARQLGVVRPARPCHAGHEQDEIGLDQAALGLHPFGRHAQRLVAQMGIDAALGHVRQQPGDGALAQALAGFFRGVEKHQLHLVAFALAAQPGVDAEQQFEHRPAARRRGLLRVAAKAAGDAPAVHRQQPLADFFRRRHALAQRDGMFDTRQLFDEAPARGDDQAVVLHRPAGRQHRAPAVLQPGHFGGEKVDAVLVQKRRQVDDQIAALAHPRGHPDQAGQIDELGLGRHQSDTRLRCLGAQGARRGEGGKARAEYNKMVRHDEGALRIRQVRSIGPAWPLGLVNCQSQRVCCPGCPTASETLCKYR